MSRQARQAVIHTRPGRQRERQGQAGSETGKAGQARRQAPLGRQRGRRGTAGCEAGNSDRLGRVSCSGKPSRDSKPRPQLRNPAGRGQLSHHPSVDFFCGLSKQQVIKKHTHHSRVYWCSGRARLAKPSRKSEPRQHSRNPGDRGLDWPHALVIRAAVSRSNRPRKPTPKPEGLRGSALDFSARPSLNVQPRQPF